MPPKQPRSSRAKIAKIAQKIHGSISKQVDATSQRADSTSQHAISTPQHIESTSQHVNSTSQTQDDTTANETSFTPITPANREMESDWRVQVLYANGKDGWENMKASQLWNLEEGKRVKCPLNEYGQGTKNGGGIVGVWLGDLATDTDLVPLHFFDWRTVPEKYINDALTLIQSKIVFETSEGLDWAWKTLGQRRKDYRTRLFKQKFGEFDSRETILANRPNKVSEDQWISFVDYRLSAKCIEMSEKNKQNHSKLKYPHAGGSKSYARRKDEMETERGGEKVGRAEVYINAQKRKDGSYAKEETRAIVEKIEEKLAEQQSQPSYTPIVSSNDALGQVLGKEHSGRVRGLGTGPCPSKVFRFHNSSFGIGETSNNASMRSELASMQQKLEILEAERAREQAERALEQAERAREQAEREAEKAREQAERAREQIERAREQARTDGILKYLVEHMGLKIPSSLLGLPPDVGSTEASPRENRPSSGASHDPSPL